MLYKLHNDYILSQIIGIPRKTIRTLIENGCFGEWKKQEEYTFKKGIEKKSKNKWSKHGMASINDFLLFLQKKTPESIKIKKQFNETGLGSIFDYIPDKKEISTKKELNYYLEINQFIKSLYDYFVRNKGRNLDFSDFDIAPKLENIFKASLWDKLFEAWKFYRKYGIKKKQENS